MRRFVIPAVLAVLCFAGAQAAPAQDGFTLLHSFDDPAIVPQDGYSPYDSLVSDGTTLYGFTREGGSNYWGTVFSLDHTGASYTLLHNFGTIMQDGYNPEGSPTLVGNTLYGMTRYGGSSSDGIIFSIGKDGSSYTKLHNFTDSPDGEEPMGSLTLTGGTLYGMTRYGGQNDDGCIFSIEPDGSGYTILHDFDRTMGGYDPLGSLLADGSTLYGMTENGRYQYGSGTIFSVGLDGSGFTTLHQFDLATGAYPEGSLISDGSVLYGLAAQGGTLDFAAYYYGGGTLFSLNPDGSDFTLLHSFPGDLEDGYDPEGDLLVADGRLFGLCEDGGQAGFRGGGTVFSIRPDGSNYTKIRSFMGGPDDGYNPPGSLITDGSTLYGMTEDGGAYYDGTVFSMPIPTPAPPATPTPVPGIISARIWVDKSAYAAGDTQLLSYELLNPLHAFQFAVDAYLALEAPDGRLFFYGPKELGRGLLRFTTAPVPVTTIGRVGSELSGTAAQFTVPPMQPGTWTWMGVVVPQGKNPANPQDRLSDLATDTFEFTQ